MSFCPTGLIHYSNYLQQAEGLPVKNGFQLTVLQTTDNLTKIRETTKVATVAGCVSGAVCCTLKLNPKIAACGVIICGFSWCLSSSCACYCEPKAKKLIKHLKEDLDNEGSSLPPVSLYSPYRKE